MIVMIVFGFFYKTRMRKKYKKVYENTVKLSKLSLSKKSYIYYIYNIYKKLCGVIVPKEEKFGLG